MRSCFFYDVLCARDLFFFLLAAEIASISDKHDRVYRAIRLALIINAERRRGFLRRCNVRAVASAREEKREVNLTSPRRFVLLYLLVFFLSFYSQRDLV